MPQKHRVSGFKFLSSAGVVAALLSAPAFAFDLSLAVRSALDYDAQFLAARKQAEADATRAAQGLGLLLPDASATASRTRTELDLGGGATSLSPGAEDRRYGNTYSITLTQPIFRLDALANFSQERERSKAGEANFAQARIDSILRVSEAYFAVLVSQDTLASIQAELKAIAEQLESAKRNFEVGTATITDQQEAQARFDLASARRFAALNDLEVKRNALAQLVGQSLPQRLRGVKESVSLSPPEPSDVTSWLDQARMSNMRVQAAQSSAEIAKLELRRVVAAQNLPSVDLVARRTRSDPYRSGLDGAGNSAGYSDTDTISLQMTLPLFNGGIALNKAKELSALRDKSSFDLENARRTAEQSARTAYLAVLAGLSEVKAYEAAEKSSRLALESNQLGYEVGVRINIDVLNAQQQLTTTQQNLSKARYDTLLNGLKLKAAVGALSEQDIESVNRLLTE
jgi:outer membrane protein